MYVCTVQYITEHEHEVRNRGMLQTTETCAGVLHKTETCMRVVGQLDLGGRQRAVRRLALDLGDLLDLDKFN